MCTQQQEDEMRVEDMVLFSIDDHVIEPPEPEYEPQG